MRLTAAVAEAEVELRAAVEVGASARGGMRHPGCPPTWPSATSGCAAHLGGVGAARLVGDRCDGCHLTLPSVEVERIHHLPGGHVRHVPAVRPDPGPLMTGRSAERSPC